LETQEIIAESPKRPGHGFGPLQIPLFRDRWIASTVSNLGTWMQDTAGTWLMTVLSAGSPLLIALMQTAASLPVLLLGLLAGATADVFERRRLLIFWQSWMLVTVGLFGGLAHILLTESYRLAPASLVAPFDYTSMLWAFVLGYVFFSEVPTVYVFIGAAVIAAAGLFVIWRERQLGLQRVRAAEGPPTGT